MCNVRELGFKVAPSFFLRVESSIFNSDPRQVLQGVKLALLMGIGKG